MFGRLVGWSRSRSASTSDIGGGGTRASRVAGTMPITMSMTVAMSASSRKRRSSPTCPSQRWPAVECGYYNMGYASSRKTFALLNHKRPRSSACLCETGRLACGSKESLRLLPICTVDRGGDDNFKLWCFSGVVLSWLRGLSGQGLKGGCRVGAISTCARAKP